MEENVQYYDTYEENLQREILRMCTSLGYKFHKVDLSRQLPS